MSDNVVLFPKQKRGSALPNSIEELKGEAEKARKELVKEFTDNVVLMILEGLGDVGIEIEDAEATTRDMIVLTEAVKSVAWRMLGYQHPLHQVADDAVVVPVD